MQVSGVNGEHSCLSLILYVHLMRTPQMWAIKVPRDVLFLLPFCSKQREWGSSTFREGSSQKKRFWKIFNTWEHVIHSLNRNNISVKMNLFYNYGRKCQLWSFSVHSWETVLCVLGKKKPIKPNVKKRLNKKYLNIFCTIQENYLHTKCNSYWLKMFYLRPTNKDFIISTCQYSTIKCILLRYVKSFMK